MRVLLSAVLDKASTMKDRSVKLIFETQELNSDDCAKLFALRQQMGWLVFASADESDADMEQLIPDEPPKEFKDDKSPSQRMRSVLFVWWTQLGSVGNFETFYRDKIEVMINWVKEKLDGQE